MPTLQHLHAADSALTCRHTGIASVHGDVNLMWHRRDRGLCPPMGRCGSADEGDPGAVRIGDVCASVAGGVVVGFVEHGGVGAAELFNGSVDIVAPDHQFQWVAGCVCA